MSDNSPILFWFRRDLRLSDHEGLTVAAATGRPVIPVFILDDLVESHGAAPKWRLGLGVEAFARSLDAIGSRLILRRGRAEQVLRALIAETGAGAVWWSRAYDPASVARDKRLKSNLIKDGTDARSHAGHVLFEPWTVKTKTDGFYRVFTPMWKAVRAREVPDALPVVSRLAPPGNWPASDHIESWAMGAQMRRGASIVGQFVHVGETAAQDRLATFVAHKIGHYRAARDAIADHGTSRLSENLTYGEISARACWHAGWAALRAGQDGAETFLKELVWREFAYHLAFHTPHIVTDNWRAEWDTFPWQGETDMTMRWKQGRTGVQLVDAAMRELYVTGTMHNRGRMIVASYLTKHLITHWKIGLDWFEDCLIDWDPASNAMGWQWSAGSGPDATPFFRIFNPDTQAEKFDSQRAYRARWLGEVYQNHGKEAELYYDAIPKSWGLSITDSYPKPTMDLAAGRARALEAYKAR